MKNIAIIAALLSSISSAALAGPVKYDPKSTPAAIAVNEQVRREIANAPPTEFCIWINTANGKCVYTLDPTSAGGTGGAGSSGE